MTKNLIIATICLLCFVSCKHKSSRELILGDWEMDANEYMQADLSLSFEENSIATLKRIGGGQPTLRQLYSYEFTDEKKYLLLHPSDKAQKDWKLAIIQVDEKKLILLSQGRDSSVRVFKRDRR